MASPTEKKNVAEIKVGDFVDLTTCPYLHDEPTARNAYGVVDSVEVESAECVAIGYKDIDEVGYPADTVLDVVCVKH